MPDRFGNAYHLRVLLYLQHFPIPEIVFPSDHPQLSSSSVSAFVPQPASSSGIFSKTDEPENRKHYVDPCAESFGI
ncbi:hypothetical protein TNCV_2579031 [Trichonephila clavipes]|nr:hypothetical protein TNCV_2579031 [Trichonephila clavipes]